MKVAEEAARDTVEMIERIWARGETSIEFDSRQFGQIVLGGRLRTGADNEHPRCQVLVRQIF